MDYSKFRRRSFTVLQAHYNLLCGSAFELPMKYTASNPTDRDHLFYCQDSCAIPWNRNPPSNISCRVFRIDSRDSPPGFARLMIEKNNMDDTPTYYHRPPILKEISTGGPSIQSKLIYKNEVPTYLRKDGYGSCLDLVFSVYSPYWPLEAEEWRRRNRFHGWPNEKLIARITRGGCHFVSKLRTWSSCDDTEWRFSFSKAEHLLIHSWTSVQKLVYHNIRVIKKDISVSCDDDEQEYLQTYYFKTLMLWACEEFPPTFWSEQDMANCVNILLFRFLRCLDEKYCPSYFIPDYNTMSNLRDKNEFGGKFKILLDQCSQYKLGIPLYSIRQISFDKSFDCQCLTSMADLFPMNKKLNGRFGEYLSECEWFLPGMKNIHAAVEAHLRLMSIDNVTSRKECKDYAVCFENLECTLSQINNFFYFNINGDLSLDESFNEILLRKQLRNSVCVYRRCLFEGLEKDAFYAKLNILPLQCATHAKFSILPLLCTASAYRANIFFTAMESYHESLKEINKCFDLIKNMETMFINSGPRGLCSLVPILICNSLSQMYDEHLRVILGFATLHRNISSSESPTSSTAHEVCLKLDAWEFLKYLYIQCEHKLSLKAMDNAHFLASISSELDDWEYLQYLHIQLEQRLFQKAMNTAHISRSTSSELQTCMFHLVENDLFSAAMLFAALRQSRAYKTPLEGVLLPYHDRPEDELLFFMN